ncbi:hypothetical protein LTR37_003300 [Vermiconidia calcicola]|uniref:Uncharacterized protein n=1 Tax=Vermiconidia calcicola TaxID=1690605 RepID=A0ACC3NQW7_9PEZI|nr:hypothetical protein LTR37_003300 [Vermiconidia calcicola]
MAKKKKGKRTSRVDTISTMEALPVVADSDPHDQQREPPRLKDDTNAFNVPAEEDKDFISSMPSEILENILSYLILDHDPERGFKMKEQGGKFQEQTHVLLSLSAMSRHFRAHVDSFCQRHLMKHKDIYHFKTDDEIDELRGRKPRRRSDRLKAKPNQETRVYRMDLIRALQSSCIGCGRYAGHRATMANGVACCQRCDRSALGTHMTLTDALRQYDLRDWMLLKSRKPGPRAKHTNLPMVSYGTVRTGLMWAGACTSYHFFQRDVNRIAQLVHGDVEEHMEKKRRERSKRERENRRELKRKLKVRHHNDQSVAAMSPAEKIYHQGRLEYFEGSDYDGSFSSGWNDYSDYSDYGDYDDIHRRLCVEGPESCDWCLQEAVEKKHDFNIAKVTQDRGEAEQDDPAAN